MYTWFKGDPEKFLFKDCTIGNDDCVLITPANSVMPIWNDENSVYRSSIWRKDNGELVSAGYRKFVNYGEQKSFEPVDPLNTDFEAIEKIDGSCLICSKYNGEYIFRTRGTTTVKVFENSAEIDALVEKYNIKQLIDDLTEKYGAVSLLFEWVTPSNIICIRYNEPDLYLTGIVRHEDYTYFRQDLLDTIAAQYNLLRPKRYSFDGITSLADLALDIYDTFVAQEGIVCYFEGGQVLKKMKSNWYLFLHRAKSELSSNKHIALWLEEAGMLEYNASFEPKYTKDEVFGKFAETYDWEIVDYIEPSLNKLLTNFQLFLDDCKYTADSLVGFTDPYQVVEALKRDDKLIQNIAWPIFRGQVINRSYLMRRLLEEH